MDALGVTAYRCRVSTCTAAENWNRTGARCDTFVTVLVLTHENRVIERARQDSNLRPPVQETGVGLFGLS